jgi:hypothetical protein
MKFLKHMSENLFITFTGIAALVHSTWSLGTMFSGVAPSGDWLTYAAWVLPAFFVAFAMDVGQISTSAAIRHNGLTWQRGLAFFVFAVATYYLQFLYIAHHMPLLPIAQGVSEFHQWTVVTARDAAIWILPLLLPLSTMFYTISDGDKKDQAIAPTLPEPTLEVSMPTRSLIEEKTMQIESSSILTEERIQEPKYLAECAACGWHKEYDESAKASRALRTHQNLHCSKTHEVEVISQNGHVN